MQQRLDDGFVLKRFVTGSVVVASYHPVIGPLFWDVSRSIRFGESTHYGLTTEIDRAHRFERDAASNEAFLQRILDCNLDTGELTVRTSAEAGCGDGGRRLHRVRRPRSSFAGGAGRLDNHYSLDRGTGAVGTVFPASIRRLDRPLR